ncbi:MULTISPECIES: pre-peptidase C-terminal domain-containing protein [unclassified Nocardioides]|uniref:pre-peptidase C-terminal domain-containing protein n=1 Tax=unclassified Nocardioides TaxID=2615069 RepID=UPI0030150519
MTHPSRRRRLLAPLAGALGLALAALAVPASTLAADPSPGSAAAPDLTPGQRTALEAGFQVAPKTLAARQAKAAGAVVPNPFLAEVPDVTKVDYAGWKQRLAAAGATRQSSASLRNARQQAATATPAAQAAVVWDEQEPDGTGGSNDTLETAERITTFGTGAKKNNVVRILGERADLFTGTPAALAPVAEDNGAIPLAGDTGLEGEAAVTTTGTLGDGPHGSEGDGSGDFDFYAVDVAAGLSIVADTSATTTDTVLALYDEAGELVAADDDGGAGYASLLSYTPETVGTYYLMVGGFNFFGPLPNDPFDSGSGNGVGEEGDYGLSIAATTVDSDKYAVRLKPGDVVGAVAEKAASGLTVHRPDGSVAVGSELLDASALYAPESPLPGGGNTTLAYVAEEAGWYVLDIGATLGDYQVRLEAYRPGAETDPKQKQTVYLDFEGGRVNTGLWGGPGVRELSPFSAFLGKWGLTRAREDAMITKITREVRDNLRDEVAEGGLNPNLQVRVVNSRNHPEVAGKENVSRVVVGGTIAESGISTIGIAQYIDPGNYGHEDTALVLLDVLSDPAGDDASLNTYLTSASDREAFVAQAVGNVTAHEVGHMVGSYHTDNLSETVNIMDSGGAGFDNLFGVGPDGIGGTADDLDVHFTEDTYTPAEGFTGLEDTLNVTAWAYPSS